MMNGSKEQESQAQFSERSEHMCESNEPAEYEL